MARVYTKIGDIFSVDLEHGTKKYFQLIAYDQTQLNSDVIRAFKTEYPCGPHPDISDIVHGEVEFYAHCVTRWGVKMDLWTKVGKSTELGDISKILFRDSRDYGAKVGEETIKISQNWCVWHINDDQFTYVGELEGENRKAEIEVVVNPFDIVKRIKTGYYDFVYPQFE